MEICKLSDIAKFTTGKLNSNAAETGGNYPFFTCAPKPLRINSYAFDTQAIILAGNNAEGNFHIQYYEGKFNAYQRTYVIESCDKERVNLQYLYYALKMCLQHFKQISQGTATKFLTAKILNGFELPIPEIELQNKVALFLSELDEKIRTNERINKNLEQQAQAIYNNMVPYSVDDTLPTEWYKGTVEDIIEIHDSKRIPLSGQARQKMEKRTYPYYGAASLMDYVDDYIFEGKYLLLGEDGTVVDAAGFPILQYVWGKFWVNNHAHIMTGKHGFTVESLMLLFRRTPVKSIVTGAVQPKISQANLKSIPVVIPSEAVLSELNDAIEPLFTQIRANIEENKSLAALRDALLPKLMSGEIDVSNITF